MRRASPARTARDLLFAALLGATSTATSADEVKIEGAGLRAQGAGRWAADVTLRHADSGWEHYADAWRVVGVDDEVYGTRTLLHPHEHEQPFTRSLSGIVLPTGVTEVWIEAHDKVHGWSAERLRLEVPAGN